uniref:Ovule protein n=1 Tax=Haemonchus placei TaxID=6290 RepID=A0A0N4WHY5_HAEPC
LARLSLRCSVLLYYISLRCCIIISNIIIFQRLTITKRLPWRIHWKAITLLTKSVQP